MADMAEMPSEAAPTDWDDKSQFRSETRRAVMQVEVHFEVRQQGTSRLSGGLFDSRALSPLTGL